MPALEMLTNYINTVGLEKTVLPVPSSKIKAPITFTKAMNSEHSTRECEKVMELKVECIKSNDVAVMNPISDVPRNKGSWVQNRSLK